MDAGKDGSGKREPSDDGLGDGEAPNKRPRNSGGGRAVDVRFLLQSRNAGAIIGKGGANINSLRKEFKASISVPDCPGPERILSIVADLDTLGDILLNIIPKLDDLVQHTGQNGGTESEMRLLMHQSHAGCIIGRGGCRIKELRESTGANIKVHGSCCPGSTERIVKVTGSPSVVVDCIKQICDITGAAPIKGLNKPYDPHNFDPEFSQEYGGFSEGAAGAAAAVSIGSLAGMAAGLTRGGGNVAFWRDEPVDAFARSRGPKRAPWGEASPQGPPPFAADEAARPWHSPPPLGAGGMHRDAQRPYRGGGGGGGGGGMARGSYGRGSYNGR
ncbi:heterogeneous nuclear ribonucleoprotein K-like [Haemaphysalis longicornis]